MVEIDLTLLSKKTYGKAHFKLHRIVSFLIFNLKACLKRNILGQYLLDNWLAEESEPAGSPSCVNLFTPR